MLSDSNARLVAARGLTRSKGRRQAGRFLAEGAQAVREALAAGVVEDLFVTARAQAAEPGILEAAAAASVPVSLVSDRAAATLSETVAPQGLVGVCRSVLVTLREALAGTPRLVAVLVQPNDPGNLGTIIRTADAAGADAVVLVGTAVDLYNGKVVRSSAGSLFHLPIAHADAVADVLAACRAAGLVTLATAGSAEQDLDRLDDLAAPTAWLFGNEAHGLPDAAITGADRAVRVPIHGRAESLNLAAAAAVCLYASARAHRGKSVRGAT